MGLKAACVISNAAEINPNAFWDVYACCPGHDLSSYGYVVHEGETGSPGICMMQCSIGDDEDVTWQQVGECLQKRVREVVCVPRFEERSHNYTDAETGGAGTVSTTRTAVASSASLSPTKAASAGAAASLDGVRVGSWKRGLVAFALLAVGSAAGMFL